MYFTCYVCPALIQCTSAHQRSNWSRSISCIFFCFVLFLRAGWLRAPCARNCVSPQGLREPRECVQGAHETPLIANTCGLTCLHSLCRGLSSYTHFIYQQQQNLTMYGDLTNKSEKFIFYVGGNLQSRLLKHPFFALLYQGKSEGEWLPKWD